jgi:hypothetical protein
VSPTPTPPAAGVAEGGRRRAAALREIADRDAAADWLGEHPELPEPDPGPPLHRDSLGLTPWHRGPSGRNRSALASPD